MGVNDGFAVAAEGLGAAGACLANAAFAAAIILLAAAACCDGPGANRKSDGPIRVAAGSGWNTGAFQSSRIVIHCTLCFIPAAVMCEIVLFAAVRASSSRFCI